MIIMRNVCASLTTILSTSMSYSVARVWWLQMLQLDHKWWMVMEERIRNTKMIIFDLKLRVQEALCYTSRKEECYQVYRQAALNLLDTLNWCRSHRLEWNLNITELKLREVFLIMVRKQTDKITRLLLKISNQLHQSQRILVVPEIKFKI